MMMNRILSSIYLLILINACTPADTNVDPFESQEDIVEIDKLIQDLMTKYSLPGASLAISKEERLVYLKAYGVADTTTNEDTTPSNIFRISGLSQTYTSLAIFKLIDEGKLKLSDKVFGEGSILGNKYGSKPYPAQLKTITISNLLQNSSGTFRNSFDQDYINTNKTIAKEGYLDYVLDNTLYQFQPGTAYKFTNFNYFLAALVIEEVSGKSYFDFLKEKVLLPVGDTESQLSKNDSRLPNEVKYFGQGKVKFAPYTFSIEGYLGSASMVTNARSLLKMVAAIDGSTQRKDLLSAASLQEMRSQFMHNTLWANGLMVDGNKLYRNEYLAGSKAAWMYNRDTKLGVAIIFNSNIDYTDQNLQLTFTQAIQDLIRDLSTKMRAYKNIDQF